MNMKKYISLFLVVVMIMVQLAIPAYATEVSVTEVPLVEGTQEDIQPRLDVDVDAHLSDSWTNIVTDDNWLNAVVTVESHGNNIAIVWLRVLNEDGQQVGSEKKVSPGYSVKMDKIPHVSGTYVLQGQVLYGNEGNYTFHIYD